MHYQLCYARVVKDVQIWKWNTLSLPPCLPAGNQVQSSVERVSLICIPLDFVCEALEFFGHVKELECSGIRAPRQVCLCIVRQPHEHSWPWVYKNCSIAENRQQTPAAVDQLKASLCHVWSSTLCGLPTDTVRARYLILILHGPVWLWTNVCICINCYSSHKAR